MGGVQGALRAQGRGFAVGPARVPIVPGAILFDLINGGDKAWGRMPPYWELGYRAAEAAGIAFALGTAGRGLRSHHGDAEGRPRFGERRVRRGLYDRRAGRRSTRWDRRPSAPARISGQPPSNGVPNSAASAGRPPCRAMPWPFRMKGDAPVNTTVAIIVTDAPLTKAQAKRLAVMAHDGFARALRPTHAALDGDVVFAAATGGRARIPTPRDLTELGTLAADALARAIARGVFEASALPFAHSLPSWRDRFGTP